MLLGYFADVIFNFYVFILIALWQKNMLRAESRRLKTSTGEVKVALQTSGTDAICTALMRSAQMILNILKYQNYQIPTELRA